MHAKAEASGSAQAMAPQHEYETLGVQVLSHSKMRPCPEHTESAQAQVTPISRAPYGTALVSFTSTALVSALVQGLVLIRVVSERVAP